MTENCIIFTTDEGEQVNFYVLEQTVLGGNTYLLVTDGPGDQAGTFLILRENSHVSDEDTVTFEILEDEQELKAVAKIFDELLDDLDLEV